MVVFTCNACGESLKKNQVEKHYQFKCRNCTLLTCIDCLKDFPGDSYQQHIKCVTEEERYSAKGWQPKPNANKNAKKQDAWVDNIRKILSTRSGELDEDVKRLLNQIVDFDNIPRKRAKFVNFVQNAIGRRTPTSVIDKTWDVFEEALKNPNSAKDAPNPTPQSESSSGNEEKEIKMDKKDQNGKIDKKEKKKKSAKNPDLDEEDSVESPEVLENQGVKMFSGTKSTESLSNSNSDKKKKRKRSTSGTENEDSDSKIDTKKSKIDDEDPNAPPGHPTIFNWEYVIRCILEKKGSLKAKKLKKKVVDEYVKTHGDTVKSRIELESKLEKKLQKNKEFKYTKDSVSLTTSRD